MAKNKINLPSSGAGITRYFEEYKSKISLKPGHVIILSIVIIIVIIILHAWGDAWLGI